MNQCFHIIYNGWSPINPACVGNGGLFRGSPRLPSIDSINAVSSPQMYAPLPMKILILKSRLISLQ